MQNLNSSSICDSCKHSLENNMHGIDQNDLEMDEKGNCIYLDRCTYCRICNPRIFEDNE